MTDYPELYRRLAEEIRKQDTALDRDAQAFVARLITQLQAEGWQISVEAERELTDYLNAAQAAIRPALETAIGTMTVSGAMQSGAIAAAAEAAFNERWPDGLSLSKRLWRWDTQTRDGLQSVLQTAIRQGRSANETIYRMQRLVERAAGGEKFAIVERYREDWATELWESAQTLIHDPKAKRQWASTVANIRRHIDQLKVTGTRRAAERLFEQMRAAVKAGNGDLAAKAVHWWIYDKQLYHLKRIARTEMATAGHRAVIDDTQANPGIIGYQWRLSASHPRPDICDYYANIEMGLGRGVFNKDSVPRDKAHPHCMCLLIPRVTEIQHKGSQNYAEFIRGVSAERRAQLLPKWAQAADGAEIPLTSLLRPDGLGLISKAEAARRGLIGASNVYEIAKAGGDYAKFYERYKNEYTARLNRAVKSYAKTIAEHESWIKNPAIKLGNDAAPEAVRRYVEDKWPRDIARNAAYKAVIEGILKDRAR